MTTTTTEHENRSEEHAESHADSHSERQRPSYDDVNVPVVFLVGLISMILTFVTIWFVEGIYYQWKNGLVTERTYEVSNSIQQETLDKQKAQLDGVPEKGIASVESVVDGIVDKYQNRSDQSSNDPSSHDDAGDSEGH